ncbi:MAG: T9SS type A sorting domain-containing protein [Ferruginibacter sp.]
MKTNNFSFGNNSLNPSIFKKKISNNIHAYVRNGSLVCLLMILFFYRCDAQCPAAPTVTSPVNYCMNTTASQLTATGTSLLWGGGASGTVGGTSTFSSYTYVDNSYNNKKMYFTTTASGVTITSVDYFVTSYQGVSGLVLSIYNSSGTIIATSSTTTTTSGNAATQKITNTFNYTIAAAGNYSIGVSAGTGNIGYDSPSYPITESSGTINITGVSASNYRCFNNLVFIKAGSSTAPTPSTTTVGSTNYTVTQTANGCTSAPATITVIVSATGGSAPTTTSPVNVCLNTTPAALTATGSNLSWSGAQGTVGGTSVFSSYTYVDATSNNKKTNFTTTASTTINTVDYFITSYQAVSGLVLSIYDNSGAIIATSSTSTTQSAGASTVKITNTFNYTLSTAGNYSIGVSAGTGNIGYDSPGFPLTESSGTINITGVTSSGNRCYNNIVFTMNANATAPVPVTTTAGSFYYYVTQTVGGCKSPAAAINVIVGSTGGTAPTVTSPVNYCQNATASPLSATGSNLLWTGANTQGTVGGTMPLTAGPVYNDNSSNNRKINFTVNNPSSKLNSIDYTIPAYQAASNLVLCLYNNAGTVIATSSTSTSVSGSPTPTTITNIFNYTFTAAGNYSIGVASGTGNLGYDNPSFPITESTGTINVTGVSSAGYRCFNNLVFTIIANSIAPTPVTTTNGTTNYTVTQTVSGCLSPAATIVVNVSTGGVATISYSGSPFCKSLSSAQSVTLTGTTGGTFSSTSGLSINSSTGAITPSASSVGTYTVTYTMNSGCTSTATTSVTISSIPAAVISYSGTPYCNSITAPRNVTRSGASGGVYSSTTGLTIDATTGAITPSTSTPGIYTVTYTITNGGCVVPVTTSVTISSVPAATISYTGSPYCSNAGTATVTQTGTTGGTYTAAAGLSINASTGAIDVGASTAGVYTITYTMINGGCTVAATASITITAVPSATISYASNPYCSNSGTATITRTGTSGGSYTASPSGLSINASTGAVTLGTSTLGTYTVTYTVAAAGGCSQFQTTASITIGTAGTWTGTSGTDWTNSTNWFCGQVPGSATNVVIPGSLSNYPVITTVQAVNNIAIQAGGSITLSNGTLQIGGTVSNAGTFNTSNGTIEFTGSVAQTIPANIFQNNAVKNLVISNTSSAGVSLAGALNLYGDFSYTGSNMKFNTNDLLTLKSTATGTANVGIMTGNTITGKVTVEKYITARKGWRLLSVPTNTTQTIKAAWQEAATNTNSNPSAGYGIQITGGTAASWSTDGFDLYSATPSMKTLNSATNLWVGISNTNSTVIKSTEGYMTFIRGDRTANAYNSPVTATILRTQGYLYTDNQPTINVSAGKFAAIGNPYTSVLDMRNISRSGFKNFFYIWDPNLSGNSGYGAYQTFSYNGSNYVVTPGGGSYGASGSVNDSIMSGQAFMMQAHISGGSLSFTESAKMTPSARISTNANLVTNPQIRINLYGVYSDNSTYASDGILVEYNDSYNNSVDDMDALKMTNTSENLSSKTENTILVIERKHSITEKDTIFLNLANTKVQHYRFELKADQLDRPGLTGFLEDHYLNTVLPLDLTGTTWFDFDIANIPASYAPDRFRVVFNQQGSLPVTFTSIKAYRKNKNINIEWNVQNEMNVNGYEVERSNNGTQFTSIAFVNAKTNNNQSANYLSVDSKPANGYNYYRVKSIDVDGKTASTGIVKVLTENAGQGITLATNLLTNDGIKMILNDMPAGKYEVNLFNNLGQKVFTNQFQYEGGSNTKTINVDKDLASGIYQVQIITADHKVITNKLMR